MNSEEEGTTGNTEISLVSTASGSERVSLSRLLAGDTLATARRTDKAFSSSPWFFWLNPGLELSKGHSIRNATIGSTLVARRFVQREHQDRMSLLIEQVLRAVLAPPSSFEQFHLAARLLDSHARFEPPDDVQEVAAPAARIGRVELKRSPHVRRFVASGREDIALRHHADDGKRRRVDPDRLAYDVGAPAECAAPEAIGDDHGPGPVRPLLFRREVAPIIGATPSVSIKLRVTEVEVTRIGSPVDDRFTPPVAQAPIDSHDFDSF